MPHPTDPNLLLADEEYERIDALDAPAFAALPQATRDAYKHDANLLHSDAGGLDAHVKVGGLDAREVLRRWINRDVEPLPAAEPPLQAAGGGRVVGHIDGKPVYELPADVFDGRV